MIPTNSQHIVTKKKKKKKICTCVSNRPCQGPKLMKHKVKRRRHCFCRWYASKISLQRCVASNSVTVSEPSWAFSLLLLCEFYHFLLILVPSIFLLRYALSSLNYCVNICFVRHIIRWSLCITSAFSPLKIFNYCLKGVKMMHRLHLFFFFLLSF